MELVQLDLSHNQITVSRLAAHLSYRNYNIQEINLLICQYRQEIPRSIGALEQLRTFSLDYNKLTALPDEICDLSCLRTLTLAANQVHESAGWLLVIFILLDFLIQLFAWFRLCPTKIARSPGLKR